MSLSKWRLVVQWFGLLLLLNAQVLANGQRKNTHPKRNFIIFVADGLRAGSVNKIDTPTLYRLQNDGVNFRNSHSLFPTLTTANASAMATGHYLGDTGDFANFLYTGFPIFSSGNFGLAGGTVIPFLENDQVLGDLNDHFSGNYLGEATLVSRARKEGYNTAVLGKLGPAAIWDVEEFQPFEHEFRVPEGIVVDDTTGRESPSGHLTGLPLRGEVKTAFAQTRLDPVAPDRSNGCSPSDPCNNGFAGDSTKSGTQAPNTSQQQYFADAVTKAILPMFAQSGKPFLLVFWSRDPDGTQHNQGDSLDKLTPGINGPSSTKALKNADDNLKQILDYIHGNPALRANTDVFVTSDHGFATISRHEIDNSMHPTQSYSATFEYDTNSDGILDIPKGYLPAGFLAIDLAHALGMKLYDPDKARPSGNGDFTFEEVDPARSETPTGKAQRPLNGNGLIGNNIRRPDGSDAKVIVAANGGSDLIYVPDRDNRRVKAIVDFLSRQDYVGGLFVDTARYGGVHGALPMRSIGLAGASLMPVPAIVVCFKVFYLEPSNLQGAVQIADTTLQEGQGMHGGFGRDTTLNFMAAVGPDFKTHFIDPSPVSNADIAVTVGDIIGTGMTGKGQLRGRVLREALKDGPASVPSVRRSLASQKAHGKRTILEFQQAGSQQYFDVACFVKAGKSSSMSCSF